MSYGIKSQIGQSEPRINWVDETVKSIECEIEKGSLPFLVGTVADHLRVCSTPLPAGEIESLLTRVKKYERDYKIFNILSRSLHQCGVNEDFKEFLTSDTVDQKLKIEFLKQEVKYDNFLGDKIQQYGIKDEKDLIEIAKSGAVSDYRFIERLKHFKISDRDAFLEIVKIAAKNFSRKVMRSIKKLGIEDENILFEIAQIAAQYDKKAISQWVSQFGHRAEKELIEVLKEVAKKDGKAVALWIGFAKITNQKALADIARLAIEQHPYGTARSFRNFGIEDEEVRIDLFEEAFRKSRGSAVSYINRFDISDKRENIKMAKISAQKNPRITAHAIKKFKIDDQEVLVELAKTIVKNIAKLEADGIIGWHIHEFGIVNPEDRIQIARLAAATAPRMTSRKIQNFDIQDEKARIGIAKIALSGSFIHVLEQLKNYQITDESFWIELAKFAAHKFCGIVSRHIKTFRIHDEKERIEIAKIEARKSGEWVSKHIKDYQITDQNALFEIAKLAACENPRETCEHLANYEIVDNNVMRSIELAKLIARKDGKVISVFISTFHIQNPNALFEIAKIAVQQNGLRTLFCIRNYKIKKASRLLEILCLAIAGSEETFSMLKNLPEDPDRQLMYLYDRLTDEELDLNSTLNELQAFEKKEWPKFTLNETIKKAKTPHAKRQLINWLAYTVGFSLYQNVNREGMMWMQNSQCLEAIYDYREPQEKYHLSNRLIHIATSEEGRKMFDALIPELPKHLLLPVMILTECQTRKVEPEIVTEIISQLKKKEFRDPSKLRPVINALNHILNIEQLTTEDFTHLLRLMSSNDIVKYSKLIDSIIDFGGARTLKKSALEEKSNDLQLILCKFFQKQIPIKDIPDFVDKYEATFESFRNPDVINIYASKLTTLFDKRPIQTLARFVESVLKGAFKEERYIGSSHLTRVFNGRETLLDEWKKGLIRPWVETNQKSSKDRVDFHKSMVQSVHHLDKELSPILIDFLRKTRKGILKEIGMQLQITEKGSRESHILLFQRYCIRLANPKLNVGEQQTELDAMTKYLGLIVDQNCEFFNDIKAMKEGLRKKEDNREGWTVVDTDNPQDLMLSGTEVLGSCQRVNGNPKKNKCLLGYIMDGKNRMLAVKDQSGKIIARSIFRILWDQENKTPVLFMERAYPSGCNNQYIEAIVSLAKERAQSLGLPLLSEEGGKIYDGTVESLSCKAPFEYCDASDGVTEGSYSIQNTKEII